MEQNVDPRPQNPPRQQKANKTQEYAAAIRTHTVHVIYSYIYQLKECTVLRQLLSLQKAAWQLYELIYVLQVQFYMRCC